MKYGVSVEPLNHLEHNANKFVFTSEKKAIENAMEIEPSYRPRKVRVIRYRNRFYGEIIFTIGT